MRPAAVPDIGTIFAEKYRVLRPLRHGGIGAIYVVEHIATGALRALKLVRPELCANERLVELFKQEARIGHRIPSDHVIDVLDAGVEEGTPWLVMELLEGEDLGEHVARAGPVPCAQAGEILGPVGHALEAAHAVGVVHRDLKPENVFLAVARREGEPRLVKLLDFGVAKVITEAGLAGTLVGTPLWMAPEQVTSAPVSPATDVWAYGLLVYWLLVGRCYWTADPSVHLRHLLVLSSGSPLPPASAKAAEIGRVDLLPAGFDAWFERCVAGDPRARFAEAGAAGRALRGVLREPPRAAPAAAWGGPSAETKAELRRDVGNTVDIEADTARAQADPEECASVQVVRPEMVREILQSLARSDCVGVALLTPLGFEAHAIVADVLEQLQRPGEPLMPIRLVPERQGAREEGFYERLLRDLRWGLPPPLRPLVERRTEASAMDRFEYAVEDLLEGPVAEEGRALLFVVEGLAHISTPQLEHWGYLMARLSNRGLKLLVWGGQELHELRTRPGSGGRFSAFHVLRAIRVGPLSFEELRARLGERVEDAAAARIFDVTRGHPALVRDLLDGPRGQLLDASTEALTARVLAGEHVARLRRALAGEPEARAAHRALVARGDEALPRGGHPEGEERLRWLGVLDETDPLQWQWSAPIMPRIMNTQEGAMP